MKANELRIGNLLDYNGIISTVVSISITGNQTVYVQNNKDVDRYKLSETKSIVLNSHQSLSLSPIPLTEEWLLKFGFREIDFGGRCFELNSVVLYPSEKYNFRLFAYGTNSLLYVHQLQNLYFALTGEELTININQ